MTDLTAPDQSARTAPGCPERARTDTRGLWDMAGPAQRGSRERGGNASPRFVGAVGRGGVHGRTWLRGHEPGRHPGARRRLRPSRVDWLTRSTYRSLVTRGFAPDEAATLTAFLCGIPIADVRWSLRQVNELLFLRAMRVPVGSAPPMEARPGSTEHASTAIAGRGPLSNGDRSSRSGADPPAGAASAFPADMRQPPSDEPGTLGTIRRCAPSSRSSPTSGRRRPYAGA